MNNNKLVIISFVGPSGAGKTTAISSLNEKYKVLRESYMELNKYKLDNRLVLSKWIYINHWFNEILQAQSSNTKTLITDRCPIDTCAYVKSESSNLLKVVSKSFDELRDMNILVKKILVTCDFDILQNRINDRLNYETQRVNYNEKDKEHNQRAYNFYQNHMELWDQVIDTSHKNTDEVVELFEGTIDKLLNDTL